MPCRASHEPEEALLHVAGQRALRHGRIRDHDQAAVAAHSLVIYMYRQMDGWIDRWIMSLAAHSLVKGGVGGGGEDADMPTAA